MSPILIVTAIESGSGFILTSIILYLILRQRRQTYQYLFAAFLFICAIWDLGTCLLMIRNEHLAELPIIGLVIGIPCGFIPGLLFHFSSLYTGRTIKWAIWSVWGLCGVLSLLGLAGLYWKIEGVYTYQWGNIFKVLPSIFNYVGLVGWFVACLSAVWLLYIGTIKAASRLEKRHYIYVLSGTLVITFAIVKAGVVMGINIPILLPLGMFLVDVFNAIIGVAIIKDRLFDITVIIKKGALFSILAALLIFIYSFMEHLLVTYVGEKIGESSTVLHLLAVAIGIAVLMPVKNRIEKGVEGYFAHRKLEF